MIRLFDANETSFTSLGIGVLSEASSCIVTEQLNSSFELEMEYPINGALFNELQQKRIIFAKASEELGYQPFRIYEITKPISGSVTISAQHISYDQSGFIVEGFEATSAADALSKIQNGVISQQTSPFTFSTDINSTTTIAFEHAYPMRSLLSGSNSVGDVYKGEYRFDRFHTSLLQSRGSDKGYSIRYSKNLTDLKQEESSDNVVAGVFPYYYKKTMETETTKGLTYQKVYTVEGATPLSSDWLSLEEGGKAFVPLVEDTPVMINTEGPYKNKIYCWNGTNYYETPDAPPNITETVNTQVEKVYYVTLSEKVIWIDEKAYPKKVVPLDMSSEFSEVTGSDISTQVTEESLRERTNAYLQDHDLAHADESIELSFVDLKDNYGTVSLGDTVEVLYTDLGVSAKLAVIELSFDSIKDRIESISIGKKEKKISDTVLTSGDNVSSLTNDKDYAPYTTVNSLIASTVTADFIQGTDARFTKAQIAQLETDKIKCSGIIEASMFDIDKVVSALLVVDDAEISNTLKAGTVEVKGTIYADAGEIGGCQIQNGTLVASKVVCDQIINDETEKIQDIIADTVTADYINAKDITAKSIIVVASDGNPIFYADANDHSVSMYLDRLTISGTVDADNVDVDGVITAGQAKIGTIITDKVTADFVEALYIKVDSAQIGGTLQASQIDVGGVISAGQADIGTIVTNKVTASYVEALGIEVSAANITGTLTADQIDATNLKVSSANITGTLTFDQIPSDVAKDSDIPEKVSDLRNDSDFQNGTQVTKIAQNEISTAQLSADQIKTGDIQSSGYQDATGVYSASGTKISLEDGTIKAPNFAIDASGNAYYKGSINAGNIVSSGNTDKMNGTYIQSNTIGQTQLDVDNITVKKLTTNGSDPTEYVSISDGKIVSNKMRSEKYGGYSSDFGTDAYVDFNAAGSIGQMHNTWNADYFNVNYNAAVNGGLSVGGSLSTTGNASFSGIVNAQKIKVASGTRLPTGAELDQYEDGCIFVLYSED